MHRVILCGMRFLGRHGVDPEERQRPQPFLVDVEVTGDFTEAAVRDDLALAVDYRDLYAVCRRIVEGRSFRLLEALGEAIAADLLRLPRVAEVTVRVKKPEARVGGPIAYEAVEVTRRRA